MSMNSNRFRYALLGASAMVSAAAVASASWAADARAYDFDMPAQPLTLALKTFGATADQQLIFSEALVKDRVAPPLKGAYTPDQALAMLLNGTGLVADKTPGGVVTIRNAADPQAGSASDGAEGTVQALIVTAQKREEDIQDVPIAISAFTQEDLTRSQVAGGPDLVTQVPNLTFTKTNFSAYSIQIRGIGTQAISETTDPAVAVAFNNSTLIRNRFFEQEFYDLERIEVLRGPQGTLYGRNATAGVVNIISAKPKDHFEAKVSMDVGNYDSTRLEGMLNLPLVQDKAALRIAGAWTKRGGYVKNLLTGDQIDGRDLWSTRVTLGLTPTDRFTANLIWEHFEENDDRLRSGKQLCHRDPGPPEVQGVPILDGGDPVFGGPAVRVWFTQGCLPASLYSPDSYQTPNGFALPYGPTSSLIGGPIATNVDPYLSATQSSNLREIESYLTPEYTASTDTVELQLKYDLTSSLTLTSETAFLRDSIFSFEDFNRFATRPNTITTESGIICNAQLGCSDRLQAGDLSTARTQHFSQEFRLASDFDGRFNFSLGANFLRYSSEDKFYVFINTIGRYEPTSFETGQFMQGYAWSNPDRVWGVFPGVFGAEWTDGNDIHHLTDLGRNYFLSKNPYNLLSYAVFGEAYYNITNNLKVTTGLRWTIDKKTAPQIPSWFLAQESYGLPTRKTFHQEWREPTGRLSVDWKPDLNFTDDTLIYASYVRGYKAGGTNPPPAVLETAPVGGILEIATAKVEQSLTKPQTFAPEFINAYEVGSKNTLLDNKLTLNLNAFYYDYTGYQISQIVDRSAVNLNFDAEVWGAELELNYRPVEFLRLGFKGGYENTRMADGSKAIDLIDRTAGDPNYLLKKPFPTFSSNCILPPDVALYVHCGAYLFPDLDPWTQLPYVPNPTLQKNGQGNIGPIYLPNGPYPGFDPKSAPNNGEGILKDLSGHELPNAPHFTATLTADLTLPLPSDWLVTLHTDLYYQSEAWTRIFNTPGYDKLKAYNNVNVAAIFLNEEAGWTVMAYVKNLLDKDNITGAFLNSDDTGLTTNVFLNEPRLYGLRVTKAWSGSEWWGAHANQTGHYPFRLELDGAYGRVSGGKEILVPDTVALFPEEHPYPLGVQNDLDWAGVGGVKFTYQPQPKSWFASAGVRYGRALGSAEQHSKWDVPPAHRFSHEKYEYFLPLFTAGGPSYVEQWRKNYFFHPSDENWYNYTTATAQSSESHVIIDFDVGKDVGLGLGNSRIAAGLRYAHIDSDSTVSMHGRPDMEFPELFKYDGGTAHRFHGSLAAHRQFNGAGPAISWESAVPLPVLGADMGDLDLDIGLSGTVLFGRQTTWTAGEAHGAYTVGILKQFPDPGYNQFGRLLNAYSTPLDYHRSTSASVPGVQVNLGVTYTLGGLKISGGYRVERYFDAIDGGIAERKTYDRQFDGPYTRISIGFGG